MAERLTTSNAAKPCWENWVICGLVIIHLVLAFGNALTPVFETQEERQHYLFIRFLRQYQQLPSPDLPWGGYQSHQAPLYHVVLALVTSFINDSDFDHTANMVNPYFAYAPGETINDNNNLRIHSRDEQTPFTRGGTVLAIFIIRMVSVVAALFTVILSYRIYLRIWPERVELRLIAFAVVCFWPLFLYFQTVTNNDVFVTTFSTAALLVLIKMMQGEVSIRSSILLGMLLGLALLSKANALFMALPVGFAVVSQRKLWRYVPIILVSTLIVGGWWYIRNIILFGDLTGISLLFKNAPNQRIEPGGQSFIEWAQRVRNLYQYVWVQYGVGNIRVGRPLYVAFNVLTVVAISGLFLRGIGYVRLYRFNSDIKKQQFNEKLVVLAVFPVIWAVFLGILNAMSYNEPGPRHLLPGIVGWAGLIALGLDAWIPKLVKLRAALSYVIIYMILAAICLTYFLLPAYQPYPMPQVIENQVSYQYGDNAILVGTDSRVYHVFPGQSLYITLYWKALRPGPADLMAYLHTLDSDLINRNSYPGTGNLRAVDWKPGETWSEKYLIRIPEDAPTNTATPIIAGLFDRQTGDQLPAQVGDQKADVPVVAYIVVHDTKQTAQTDFMFGDLLGASILSVLQETNTAEICIRWAAHQSMTVDYHAFVHLFSQAGELLGNGDYQIGGSQFPTSFWLPGDTSSDCTKISVAQNLKPGWRIRFGAYNFSSGERLPAESGEGQQIPLPDMVEVNGDSP